MTSVFQHAVSMIGVGLLGMSAAIAQIQTPPGATGRPQAPAAASPGPAGATPVPALTPSGQPPTYHGGQQTAPLSTYLPPEPGAIPWTLLSKVKMIQNRGKFTPEFDKEVMALNNREVKIQGFMMPLETGEKQRHFLLTITPQTCAFCIPAGPEGMVEIRTKTPIKVTFEPLVLTGKFEVLANDPMGLYYRMPDGKSVR
jgi:uncharacterized protein